MGQIITKKYHIAKLVSEDGGPDRFGLYEDGKLINDCAKLQTAVNALGVAVVGGANAVCPAAVTLVGEQGVPWESVQKEKKQPEYEPVDLGAIEAALTGSGDGSDQSREEVKAALRKAI